LVMEGSSGEEFALPGKLVRLMLSPVPLRQLRMRPEHLKYTPIPAVIRLCRSIRSPPALPESLELQP
jgi:hypothetical protein